VRKLGAESWIGKWLFGEKFGFGGLPGVCSAAAWAKVASLLLIDPQLATHIPEYFEYVLNEKVVTDLLLTQPHIEILQLLQPILHPEEFKFAGLELVLLLIQDFIVLLNFHCEFVVVLLQELLQTYDLGLELLDQPRLGCWLAVGAGPLAWAGLLPVGAQPVQG
jgi:hypothetical protein